MLLHNGTIVDGSGEPGFRGALWIEDGRIEAVSRGPIEREGPQMDCTGLVVAPGFIDAHSHNDWIITTDDADRLLAPFTEQGVTTHVAGNCGFAPAGFRRGTAHADRLSVFSERNFAIEWTTMTEWFATLAQRGMLQNLVMQAGHGTARASMRGFDGSPLTDAERDELHELLAGAMDEGAVGVSFGLGYEPGIYADDEEVRAIARLVRERDKIVTVHLRAYSWMAPGYPGSPWPTPHSLQAIDDMVAVARETGVRLQLSHMVFVGLKSWRTFDRAIQRIDSAIDEGLDIAFDTYPYHLGMTVFNALFPPWFLRGAPATYDSTRARAALYLMVTAMQRMLGFQFDHVQLAMAASEEFEAHEGQFFDEIARARDASPFATMIECLRHGNGQDVIFNHNYSDDAMVEAMIRHPAALFQTDATVFPRGAQNPAAYGTFPRFLELCRDRQLLSLEQAVHKMTGATAARFGLQDRGVLCEGAAADVVVFDPDAVRDPQATGQTGLRPEGIEAVFVNGERSLSGGVCDPSVRAGVVVTR